MQLFKITVLLCQIFSAAAGPICIKFGMIIYSYVAEKDKVEFLKVQKPDHDDQKYRKIGNIFTPTVPFPLAVTKQLNIFNQIKRFTI
jgi:hypothetical protein